MLRSCDGPTSYEAATHRLLQPPVSSVTHNSRGNKVVVGITSGGTGDLCGAGWDLYTSVFAELTFIDSVMNGAPPPDPNPMPDNPLPDPNGGGKDKDDGGGCNTGRGNGWLLGLGIALIASRRRHR